MAHKDTKGHSSWVMGYRLETSLNPLPTNGRLGAMGSALNGGSIK